MATTIGPVSNALSAQAAHLLREALPVAKLADTLAATVKQSGGEAGQAATAAISAQMHAPAAQVLGNVQMLVAISALSPQEERRRIQADHARKGLDSLDKLHAELLDGEVDPATLKELVQWLGRERDVADMSGENDSQFDALMHDIELRVRVELAKFDVEI